ncbi:MAG: hypothetical protein OEY86_11480 [Nitrospira sp.]|nr:hypothetical protein [Nitrospira sp.]
MHILHDKIDGEAVLQGQAVLSDEPLRDVSTTLDTSLTTLIP